MKRTYDKARIIRELSRMIYIDLKLKRLKKEITLSLIQWNDLSRESMSVRGYAMKIISYSYRRTASNCPYADAGSRVSAIS